MKRVLVSFVMCVVLLGCTDNRAENWVVGTSESSRLFAEFVALGVDPREAVIGCEAPRGSDGRVSSSASLRATFPDSELDKLLVALRKGEEVPGRDGWRDFNLPAAQSGESASAQQFVFLRLKGNQLVLFVSPDGSCAPGILGDDTD
jgi:hypothetical protein